jgi:hypothetical protein
MISPKRSLINYEDYWQLPLSGRTVSRFNVDNTVSIEFLDPGKERLIIILEQCFTIWFEGIQYLLSPNDRIHLGPLFLLLHHVVIRAWAFKDGRLRLEVENTGILEIEPHPEYEAWSFVGEGGMRIVCLPGGELAVWEGN